jgi:IS30 family transposase
MAWERQASRERQETGDRRGWSGRDRKLVRRDDGVMECLEEVDERKKTGDWVE